MSRYLSKTLITIFILAVAVLFPDLVNDKQLNFKEIRQILGVYDDNTEENLAVVDIVDGDTIKINIEGKIETVRLLSIDTPETKDPRKPVQCFGLEATNKLKELTLGKSVALKLDSFQGDRDRYGRLLRYVYLADGTFVNAEMVKSGYAFAYTKIESDQLAYMQSLEIEARTNNAGLWGQCEYGN